MAGHSGCSSKKCTRRSSDLDCHCWYESLLERLVHWSNKTIGVDENDQFTVSDPRDADDVQKPKPGTDFAAACDPLGLQGLRIAVSMAINVHEMSADTTQVPRHILSKDAVVNVEFDKGLKIMESLGAKIVDNAMFSEFNASYTYSDAEEWNLGLQVDIYNSKSSAK